MHELRKTNYIFLFSILVIIDQLSKYIIRFSGGFYICNQNIAFGIKISETIFWAFWFLIVFLLATILYKKYSAKALFLDKGEIFYTVLILAGAISNATDRLVLGCVVDFFRLPFWPVFNLADIYITIGSTLFVYKVLKKK